MFRVKWLLLLTLIGAVASFGQVIVNDNKLTLAWDPNVETDLSGYKVYKSSTSGVYGAALATVPVMVAPTYQVVGLVNGTYYFVVRAYNQFGESGNSNEVSARVETTPVPPSGLKITTPPIAFMIGRRDVQIAWTTNLPASSDVVYNRDGFLPSTVTDSTSVTNHIQVLSRLQPNQVYRYTVSSSSGGETVSSSGSFISR